MPLIVNTKLIFLEIRTIYIWKEQKFIMRA